MLLLVSGNIVLLAYVSWLSTEMPAPIVLLSRIVVLLVYVSWLSSEIHATIGVR